MTTIVLVWIRRIDGHIEIQVFLMMEVGMVEFQLAIVLIRLACRDFVSNIIASNHSYSHFNLFIHPCISQNNLASIKQLDHTIDATSHQAMVTMFKAIIKSNQALRFCPSHYAFDF